jgi:hypothetical protein
MGGSYATADAGVPDAQPIDAAAFPDGGASPSSRHTLSTATSGLLTAGAWDDNRNFIRFTRYRAGIVETLPGAPPFTVTEHEQALSLFNPQPPPRQVLDVSLVIDTTGSMSDELGYLQNEFLAITTTIAQRYPNAQQRWSVVLYRDYGDEYVTRWFDFRSDLTEFQTHLAAQSASGGGDMPEQPDKALGTMAQLAWRSGTGVAKLAFWVGDAPHHDENAASMAGAVRASAAQGIHIYPVAGSGIDPLGELTMRSAAQLTGGRYLFLTSDSGVGGAHAEPTIPCYFVTKLNEAILRMVDVEMTGVYHEPNPEEVIRTGGNPEDGACHLSSGEQVQPF